MDLKSKETITKFQQWIIISKTTNQEFDSTITNLKLDSATKIKELESEIMNPDSHFDSNKRITLTSINKNMS